MNKKKSLPEKFAEFNERKRLAHPKKRALIAVSGGIDSMVLCHLFHQAGFPFAIAHCNFGLRGKESDDDARFVRNAALKYKVKVFVKKFETQQYADEHKVSIQMAARELRYAWFEELRAGKNFDLIATAHHLNDNIETIIYNLAKGTGIKGLRGILARQGHIIRPLLFASRAEIEAYRQEHIIDFREDSSNADDKYARNKIRHNVIPVLQEINPALENTFAEKIDLFGELERLYEHENKKLCKQLFLPRGNDVYIPLAKLNNTPQVANALYEYLAEHGFNASHIEDMLSNRHSPPGSQYLSDKARIIKDRRFFILTQLPEKDFTAKLIEEKDSEVLLGDKKLEISTIIAAKLKISKSSGYAFIDKAKLEFPLLVRRWKQGDYFYPFGMKMKKKKLKKFFIDQKIPLNQKEAIWVIESNKKIVWVVGHRLDERFKVTEATKEVYKIGVKEIK